MDGPVAELRGRLAGGRVDPHAIRSFLDGLAHGERVSAIRGLGRSQQRRLYDAVDGFLPLRLVDLVPPSAPTWTTVRHFGRNTLPAFTHFEKRFCRPREADAQSPGRLFGFNFQTLSPITGPGYFVAVDDPARPEVRIDYGRVPEEHPDDWPPVRPNERGLSRFVYGYMLDTLRRVSEQVTIGSAARKGRDMGSWFVLCREV